MDRQIDMYRYTQQDSQMDRQASIYMCLLWEHDRWRGKVVVKRHSSSIGSLILASFSAVVLRQRRGLLHTNSIL